MEQKHHSSLSRQELYDLVWATPVIQLAKTFGLSDQGLRKVCINQQVPLPKAGYWAKVAAGQTLLRPPLLEFSEKKQDARNKVARNQRDEIRKLDAAAWQPPASSEPVGETMPWHRAISELRKNILEAARKAERLKNVSEWEDQRPGRRHPDRDRLSLYGSWRYEANRGEQLVNTHGSAPLRVSLSHHLRALRVLNAVLNRAADDGYQVVMARHEGRFELTRDSLTVRLRLTEKMETQHHKELRRGSKTYEQIKVLVPTGRLAIFVEGGGGGECAITDQPGNFLETRLDEIMAVVSRKVISTEKWEVERKARQRQWDEERLRQQEELRAQEAERQRRAEEAARKAALLAEAESWSKLTALRKYLSELDSRRAEGGIAMEGYEAWRAWAETAANECDPSYLRVRPAAA